MIRLSGSVSGGCLPSAFVGQLVGIETVGSVWIGDSGAPSHMTGNADAMYGTSPPPLDRSRVILGDGSNKKAQFIEKTDLIFHSRTNYPVTLYVCMVITARVWINRVRLQILLVVS